jgi:hypothetical protein
MKKKHVMKAGAVLLLAGMMMGCGAKSTERPDASIKVYGVTNMTIKNVSYWDYDNEMPLHWQSGDCLLIGNPKEDVWIDFSDPYGYMRTVRIDKRLKDFPRKINLNLNSSGSKREEYKLTF